MGATLIETGGQYSSNRLEMGMRKIIAQTSPVLDRIKNTSFKGNAYSFQIESALPPGQWRAVGGSYTRGSGNSIRVTENVYILGAEVFVDNFELNVAADKIDLKMRKFKEAARGAAMTYDATFFEGSTHTNPLGFLGLRYRLSGNQLYVLNSTPAAVVGTSGTGQTLALNHLDVVLDAVPIPNKVMYMNRTLRRKITSLAQAATGTVRVEYPSLDKYGKQVTQYNGVDILIVERADDGSTFLAFDEDPGDAGNDTTSIYVVAFGDEENVFGLMGAEGSFECRDLGESEISPGKIGRLEFYPGMAIAHPRAAARLFGITNT